MYHKSHTQPPSASTAARARAAASRNAKAQYSLGVMYENAQGVAQDYGEAARLYRLAAEQAYAEAQLNLGVMSAIINFFYRKCNKILVFS